jgi:hypothetical protein
LIAKDLLSLPRQIALFGDWLPRQAGFVWTLLPELTLWRYILIDVIHAYKNENHWYRRLASTEDRHRRVV